ncbi:hypothetical protein [Allorhizobium taibaishanense]|uniref:Uncharacterized protein n=1 Tax=Allorhizobium taibaishanense TaxID=887144 RepID=A0A7W6HJC2_9HYPH|nr:hypothetical protein [Allorhizobium taibaishanense]MBB4006206.1 hypothetical protein [Allorhizobium taibaishanense]
MRLAKSAEQAAERIFYCLDLNPPETVACRDRLYAAFSHYRPVWNWCRQCFAAEEEEKVRRHPNPRTTPGDIIAPLYHEHPRCSGGRETFLHWLPRSLELFLLDSDICFLERLLTLAPWQWPAEEQGALREVLTRAAIGWFTGNDPSPLHIKDHLTRRPAASITSETLVCALLCLRVDPFALFAWLARTGGQRAHDVLLELAYREDIIDPPFYWLLEEGSDQALQPAFVRSLNRVCRDALSRIVAGGNRAERLWIWAMEADVELAADITASESLWRSNLLRLSPSQRRSEGAIVASAIPSGLC